MRLNGKKLVCIGGAEGLLADSGRARRMGAALRHKAWAMLDPAEGAQMQTETYRFLLRKLEKHVDRALHLVLRVGNDTEQ